jgi:hypothetical protein
MKLNKKLFRQALGFSIFTFLLFAVIAKFIGLGGRGQLNKPGPLTWLELFHQSPYYLIVAIIFGILFYKVFMKGKTDEDAQNRDE